MDRRDKCTSYGVIKHHMTNTDVTIKIALKVS